MIEELIKELSELQEYKKKYESAQKDKQKMSDLLFEYMMKEYKKLHMMIDVRSKYLNNAVYVGIDMIAQKIIFQNT